MAHKVSGNKDGYRRAGKVLTKVPQLFDDLTDEQVAAMEADPWVMIQEIEDPKAKGKGKAPAQDPAA